MNAVGIFGEWIVKHQLGLEVLLLALLGALLVAILVQAVRREKRKKSILNEIDRKIDDINQQVNGIYGKLMEEKEASASETTESNNPAEKEAAISLKEEEKQESEIEKGSAKKWEVHEGAVEDAQEEDLEEKPEEDSEEDQEDPISNIISLLRKPLPEETKEEMPPVSGNPSIRFYSRDWGVDKHGNVYTEEMLRKQIG